MKETIEFIKKLWKNKKTRSLAILIMYVVFFAFVFLLISSGSHNYQNNVENENIENNDDIKLEDITNYRLEIIGEDNFTYDSNTNKVFYDGIYYEVENIPEIIAYNKCDKIHEEIILKENEIYISAKTGKNLENLKELIKKYI